jgi:hypothetical protein
LPFYTNLEKASTQSAGIYVQMKKNTSVLTKLKIPLRAGSMGIIDKEKTGKLC